MRSSIARLRPINSFINISPATRTRKRQCARTLRLGVKREPYAWRNRAATGGSRHPGRSLANENGDDARDGG